MSDQDGGVRPLFKKMYDGMLTVQKIMEERARQVGKGKYSRILKMARHPTDEEYSKTVIITGAGILIIGGLGFVIYLAIAKGVPILIKFLGL